jgi:hypothetical protein
VLEGSFGWPSHGRDRFVRSAIRTWRDGLINLTGSNRLLNFKPSRTGVFRPGPQEVLSRVARGGFYRFRSLQSKPVDAVLRKRGDINVGAAQVRCRVEQRDQVRPAQYSHRRLGDRHRPVPQSLTYDGYPFQPVKLHGRRIYVSVWIRSRPGRRQPSQLRIRHPSGPVAPAKLVTARCSAVPTSPTRLRVPKTYATRRYS